MHDSERRPPLSQKISNDAKGRISSESIQDNHVGRTHYQHHCEDAIHVRKGAYLPHWTKPCSLYSVTFRLADSLPQSVIKSWLAQRRDIIQTAKQMGRLLTEHEEKRLQYLFSDRLDRYLDAGYGSCWMKQHEIAKIVSGALKHFDGERYQLVAWCVMPNHVHTVVQPFPGYELSDILHTSKSYTGNKANKALRRRGPFWQHESYDHLIRDDKDLSHAIEYVLDNPVNAGLRNWVWTGLCEYFISPGP